MVGRPQVQPSDNHPQPSTKDYPLTTTRTRPSRQDVVREPIIDGSGFSELRLPDGTRVTDGRSFIAQYLVQRYDWIDDPRPTPQSNSAQAFATGVYMRYPAITSDEHTMIPDLVDIVLQSNSDPHDTDVLGTVLDLLDYIGRSVL
jgi:hypothetical protein